MFKVGPKNESVISGEDLPGGLIVRVHCIMNVHESVNIHNTVNGEELRGAGLTLSGKHFSRFDGVNAVHPEST
jgi:hypothetical protein